MYETFVRVFLEKLDLGTRDAKQAALRLEGSWTQFFALFVTASFLLESVVCVCCAESKRSVVHFFMFCFH